MATAQSQFQRWPVENETALKQDGHKEEEEAGGPIMTTYVKQSFIRESRGYKMTAEVGHG